MSNERQNNDGQASGWGQSHDGKCSFGYSSLRGKRASMEDFYEARFTQVEGSMVGLFGVYDGHGGSRAADYVRKHLLENLLNHPQFVTDTKTAIIETYQQTDSEFLKAEYTHQRDAGTTASTAVVVGDRLLVANVGDSRAVICRAGKAEALSTDHKPNRRDERLRIEKAGGVVMWAGTWRVGGVLAVSRAFGDRQWKKYVVADPELREETINDEVEFLVLASDGLWDVVSNEEAVSMVQSIPNAQDAARKLTEEALKNGSADNITCIVIRFHNVA
ncbi:hypothetical protein KP509_02G112900 [Ceratopteris richardii]|uniref:protein-serine/threonine phosphatase n=1 Tax=Ceratopteris richardii TaxID=49495 RepID=A0A8T2VHY6_CERRI|nr:hypothetical protein KP509_02G112900 [Ceratopteris richardii]KAH7445216.1 hypothetical protein KP509_02G112900 [Ceratopteris richardii]